MNRTRKFSQRLLILAGVSGLVVILDQISKLWILKNLGRRESITVVENFFHIVHVHNTGAAFGVFASWKNGPIFLTVVSCLAIVFVVAYYFVIPATNRLASFSLALVLGGAVGNLIDRVRLGYVVDFIDWHYAEVYHWPAFNIADSAISVAVFLLVIDLIRDLKRKKQEA